MTLAPVFRSPEAVSALEEKGYWTRLAPSFAAHREANTLLAGMLRDVIDPQYLHEDTPPDTDLAFMQDNFFLILFRSLFESLGCNEERLHTYTLLNICIRGLVMCGDNFFDDEEKIVLPLCLGRGKRFRTIVQWMCFQTLVHRILDQHAQWLSTENRARFEKDLLSALTFIGHLEGSEEGGVDEVPGVQEMIDGVHRVRGGSLFSLAFIAPRIGEADSERAAWEQAEEGIRRLGTAFQIVDDLTDLEFDLGRRSHNLLMAQVVHEGSDDEKALIEKLLQSPEMRAQGGWVEKSLNGSASKVMEIAKLEAEKGFETLKNIGFWFLPDDALLFVRAIAGDAGFRRIQGLNVS